MNPSPRPPSPRAREAMQRALRRENPNQLSSRDARVLMGLPVDGQQQQQQPPPPLYDGYHSRYGADSTAPPPQLTKTAIAAATNVANSLTPPRPAREQRRNSAILQETVCLIHEVAVAWVIRLT
jgi:hypothetical protein